MISIMNLNILDLCKTFQERALWTNDIINQGFSSTLGILEETITDMHLIEINRRHKDYIYTRKFNRREEGNKSGADWIWSFGRPGSWISLLIQAKIVNPKNGKCNYLNYRNGEQRRSLTTFGRKYRLYPIYCIYNLVKEGITPLSKSLSSLSNFDTKQWACSLIIPKYIRIIIKNKANKQSELLRYGFPWAAPFHINESESSSQIDLANQISTSIAQLLRELGENFNLVRNRWEAVNPQLLVTDDLPYLVKILIASKLNKKEVPISGIGIISQVPIRDLHKEVKFLPEITQLPVDFSHLSADVNKADLKIKVK